MKVSELAKKVGVTPETVRFYTRSGLLSPKQLTHNGYHYYSQQDLTRLLFIRKARVVGFSLNEITEILAMSQHGQSPCPRVRTILEERLNSVQQQLKELKSLQASLEDAAKKMGRNA